MENPKICPGCGTPLAPNGPQGLCPACLMKAGFLTGAATESTNATSARANRFTPPAPAALAQYFPQLEILELIGQGGMGAVYKARQPALDRLVALKILPTQTADDPGFAERFAREARALARLNHPNIVAVYDFGQAGDFHYFVMELVDGANLRQIERAGKLSANEALQIIPQICEALQFAHDAGIVHRDIKPENILLDKKGRVKIADFGLAKIFGTNSEPTNLTEPGHVMGTPHYMAPEQVEHPLEVDHRADIYSLGVVFYEMLTGELPLGRFAAPSKRVTIDVRLDDVVLRTLEKEPSLRYQQASAVKTAVENIAGGGIGGGSPPPIAPVASASEPSSFGAPRYSRLAIAGAICLIVAFIALGVSYMTPQKIDVMAETSQFFENERSMAAGRDPLLVGFWTNFIYLHRYVFTPIGFIAAIGATILGWIAVAQIRRSRGKLCGLWLAMVDGLLVPLLLLDVIIVVLGGFLFAISGGMDALASLGYGDIFLLLAIFIIFAIDGLIVKAVWYAVTRPVGPSFFRAHARILLKTAVATFVAVLLCGLFYLKNATPEYVATASLRVFRSEVTPLDAGPKDPTFGTIGPEDFNTRIRLMETRDIAVAVAARMSDQERRDFLLPFRNKDPLQPELPLVDRLMSRRVVTPGPLAYIIQIGVEHPDPQIAAKVADYFAEEFINYNSRINVEKAMKAVEELTQQSTEQGNKVAQIQEQLNALAEKYGTLSLDPANNVMSAKLQQLNSLAVTAQSELDVSEERWKLCQDYQANNKPLWNLSFIASDKQVSDLLTSLNTLNLEIALLSRTYGEQHPEIVARTQRRQALETELQNAAATVAQQVYADYQGAQDRYNRASQELNDFQQQVHDLSISQIDYDHLQSLKVSAQAMQGQMLTTIKQQRSKIILGSESYQIIDYASGSVQQSEPKTVLVIFGSLFGGVLAGVFMSLLLSAFLYVRWAGKQSAG